MNIVQLHPNFKMPIRSTELAGGFDIYMPEAGSAYQNREVKVGLGFALTVPKWHIGLLLPRSGVGSKHGIELNNTAGVMDHDYTGEWFATILLKRQEELTWKAGDRLLQFVVLPVCMDDLVLVDSLDETKRGAGGLGSTGV